MDVICLYRLTRDVYKIFISSSYAGGSIIEAIIEIDDNDVIENNMICFNTYREAHKYAHLTEMSEDDYNMSYNL